MSDYVFVAQTERDPEELARGCVIEYDATSRWLIATEWIGPAEYGGSAIIAENVPGGTGEAIVAAIKAARQASDWANSIGSGPIDELNADLVDLHRLVRAIR